MMRKSILSTTLTIALSGLLAGTAAAQCGTVTMAADTKANRGNDIVATAVAAGQFKTLAAALDAAGLIGALQGEGPFTVFAPTDEAFAKLPAGTVENLLKPENKATLIAILTYHVVPGKLMAAEVTKASGATTLNGQRIAFATKDGVTVNNAKVVKADVAASNGVIHVIDTVILPATDNVVVTAKNAKTFETLLAAATAAGLAETLSGDGPFTVFAPTDEAFGKLPAGTVENLLKPENKEALTKLLLHHVVSGRAFSTDAIKVGKAKTLAGTELPIRTQGSDVRVAAGRVIKADINASNGVIHVIDQVLLVD
jgi:transforming growth factor-beta-induced protein